MTALVNDRAGAPLLQDGLESPAVDEFRERVRTVLERDVAPLVAEAEAERRFPRAAIESLGAAGVFRERWAGEGHGDLGRSIVLAEQLGAIGLGGIGVGISLHLEAATAILHRFAESDEARACLEGALDGRLVACLATSEQHVGSDLTAVRTRLDPDGDGYHVHGRKWFVSPGAAADFALVLCRSGRPVDGARSLRVAPLALAIVPRDGLHVERVLETTGMRGLGTARITIDARIEPSALVGRTGTALLAVSWGLTHERLALAAQALGGAALALRLAVTHAHRRRQFGVRLIEHQALRLRLADLDARVRTAARAVLATAASLTGTRRDAVRDAAGLKVSATRLAEHVVGECAHIFGGTGYLEEETPIARMWRDVRIGRLGAGSDEMMWELVAGGLRPDDDLYDRWMAPER